MKILTIGAALLLASIAITRHSAGVSEQIVRECRDPAGHLLYRVRGSEVVTPTGLLIGTVKNGEVRDRDNHLLAREGDPGLLYCLARH